MDKDDLLLQATFKRLGIETCKHCGKILAREDIAWNNGNTEYGTPFSVLEIICQVCDEEVAYKFSWYPEIDSIETFCEELIECYKR